jgi:uncharacterized protein YeaO (DUF488 family)
MWPDASNKPGSNFEPHKARPFSGGAPDTYFMIQVKRAYDPPAKNDGIRLLVDHLWPRGVKKEALRVEHWIKEVSPSTALRNWFGHEPAKWKEFQRRYFEELKEQPGTWTALLELARENDLTLVFSARDTEHNNAVALKAFLDKKLARNR